MKFKELFHKKIFWTWFIPVLALIGITLYFLASKIILVLIILGISLVVGFIIDIILLKKKKR